MKKDLMMMKNIEKYKQSKTKIKNRYFKCKLISEDMNKFTNLEKEKIIAQCKLDLLLESSVDCILDHVTLQNDNL